MTEPSRYWAYFDEAWKKIIVRFFPQFLQFFILELYADVDFSKKPIFLDKEMEELAQRSLKGSKFVDKLVQVFLKDGSEEWLLLHVEVQGEEDDEFSLRMYRYFYRIFDRHGKRIVSLAVLAGSEIKSATGTYTLTAYDSGVEFRYLTRKLMDYERDKLEADTNPMALVVLAAQERERLRRSGDRFNAKLYLIRKLYERGYSREDVIDLFEFIDWVIRLSDEEENQLWEEMETLEEVKQMPYITSVERIGIRKGSQQGRQQMVMEELAERFGEGPSLISNAIHQIEDSDQLRALMHLAIQSGSLEEFQQSLNGENR